jgi:hypothetical protein
VELSKTFQWSSSTRWLLNRGFAESPLGGLVELLGQQCWPIQKCNSDAEHLGFVLMVFSQTIDIETFVGSWFGKFPKWKDMFRSLRKMYYA